MLVKSSRVFLCWFLSWFKNRRWDTGLPRARRLQRPGRPELMWWTEKDRTAFWGCQSIQKKGGVFFLGFFSRFFWDFFFPFSGGRKVRGRKEGRKEGKGREGKERKGKERREEGRKEGRKEGWYACFAAMLWQNHKGGWYGPPSLPLQEGGMYGPPTATSSITVLLLPLYAGTTPQRWMIRHTYIANECIMTMWRFAWGGAAPLFLF